MTHLFPLAKQKPEHKTEHGYRLQATQKNFPLLRGMSFYKLVLHDHAVREPHWHANADELGYCLRGKILISFYANQDIKQSFLISPGEAFLIPSGALHTIENIEKETAEILLQFSHAEPEDFSLSATVSMFSDSVLGNTWGLPASHFQNLKRPSSEPFIFKPAHPTSISPDMHYLSKYQFSLEARSPLVSHSGGTAKVARQDVWPILHRQALYSLHLTGIGMREPHWHPETGEMGYVESGRGRMSILSPSGNIDTYEMGPGDLYFIPKAYPHHIENLNSKEDLHVLIFFDQPMPGDIGFTGSLSSFPTDLLAGALESPRDLFTHLPKYYKDLFIVQKTNPTK